MGKKKPHEVYILLRPQAPHQHPRQLGLTLKPAACLPRPGWEFRELHEEKSSDAQGSWNWSTQSAPWT